MFLYTCTYILSIIKPAQIWSCFHPIQDRTVTPERPERPAGSGIKSGSREGTDQWLNYG